MFLRERAAADEKGHAGRVLGKVDGGLAGGICRTDNCDLASAVGSCFGRGRAVVDAGADQPFDSGSV